MDYKKLYEEQIKENEELKQQLEVDEDGFACSDWFYEKMNKHIHYHVVEEGGEYNHFDKETNKRVYHLGEGGSLDEIREYVEQQIKENEKLKRANEINAELHDTSEEVIGELEKENKREIKPHPIPVTLSGQID